MASNCDQLKRQATKERVNCGKASSPTCWWCKKKPYLHRAISLAGNLQAANPYKDQDQLKNLNREHMSMYAFWSTANSRYVLGAPVEV